MPITPTKKIWMNGTLVDWDDAKIHVLNPTLHYGWGVFEGIRAYGTSRGTAVFRLTDHIARLFRSAKVYFMEPDFTAAEIVAATKQVVRIAEVESCYIRPLIYLGYGEMGLNPLPSRTEVMVACWPWGLYLGPGGDGERLPGDDVQLAAHQPELDRPAGQGHRAVRQLLAEQGRRAQGRVRRGGPAQPGRQRRAGHRREHLRRAGPDGGHPADRRRACWPASPATR